MTRAIPNSRVLQVPIPDGGEGFAVTMAAATGVVEIRRRNWSTW